MRRLLHLGDEVDGMHAARRLSAELSTVVKAEAQVRVRVVGPRAGVLWRGRVAQRRVSASAGLWRAESRKPEGNHGVASPARGLWGARLEHCLV